MNTTDQVLPEARAVADMASAGVVDGSSQTSNTAVVSGMMAEVESKKQEAFKTSTQAPFQNQESFQNEDWVNYREGFRCDTPIMRFMPRKYFLEMISNCRNTLMHVSTWADVYEGLIYKQKYFTMDNNKVKCPVSHEKVYGDFFGQCWTKTKYDSELLWNARCPNKDGVCIKTTVGRLANSIANTMPPDFLKGVCCLDKIDYWDEAQLNKWIQDFAERGFSSSHELTDLFFVKRESFRDEDEVRLMYVYDASTSPSVRSFYAKKLFVQYEIFKDAFLTEVVLDPRMSEDECQAIKCEVCKANWRCNGVPLQVSQSSLYKSTVNEFII